jgi:hypothetical protein
MTLIGTPNKRRGDNMFNTDIPNWIAILASHCEGVRARDHRAREVPHIQSSKEMGRGFADHVLHTTRFAKPVQKSRSPQSGISQEDRS